MASICVYNLYDVIGRIVRQSATVHFRLHTSGKVFAGRYDVDNPITDSLPSLKRKLNTELFVRTYQLTYYLHQLNVVLRIIFTFLCRVVHLVMSLGFHITLSSALPWLEKHETRS